MQRYLLSVLMAAGVLLAGCSGSNVKRPVNDHFDGKTFVSPYGMKPKGFLDLLRWQINGEKIAWPNEVKNVATPQVASDVPAGQAVVTFVNHASVLMQMRGLNLLTDPVWSLRTSPYTWIGPKRVREPGLEFEKLPKIDLVLVSHNHYDHWDTATIKRLVKEHNPMFLIALGDARLMEEIPDARFTEMDWWESYEAASGIKVHFLPSQHWSARGLFDRNHSLWGSFLVEGPGMSVYFAGDTGYARHFAEIAAKFPKIDLALLPIGAYEPRWFMKDQHMNPEDAVQAHRDLKASQSMAIHFGTFQLTDEGIEDPVKALQEAKGKAGLSQDDFIVMQVGETRSFAPGKRATSAP